MGYVKRGWARISFLQIEDTTCVVGATGQSVLKPYNFPAVDSSMAPILKMASIRRVACCQWFIHKSSLALCQLIY